MFVREAWYTAGWSTEVTEKPMARRLLGDPVVLYRDKSGRVAALLDSCCHRGAPLSMGQVVEAGLQCGYHGLVFDRDGNCCSIPNQPKIPSKARVKSYPVVERQGFIWIWMGRPENADPAKIIDFPYLDDTKEWPSKTHVIHIKANSMLMVDNLMDLTHVGYIHTKTIGGNPALHVEAKTEVTQTDHGLRFVRWMLNSVPPPTYAKAVHFAGNVDRWQEFEFVAPSHILQYSGAKDVGTGAYEGQRRGGIEVRLIHSLTPETETSCHYIWAVARGFKQDVPAITEGLFKDLCFAFAEDKEFVEAQQERITELGEDWMTAIATDNARLHMRRTVKRLLDAEQSAEIEIARPKAALAG
jgi:phenylpropionate dioxygenase-like ring-hydroxylating dioxygenase large terminal subunit